MGTIRLQVDVPVDLSAEMHRRIAGLRATVGRTRGDMELTNVERNELSVIHSRSHLPEFAGEMEKFMKEHRLMVPDDEAALRKQLKIPLLTRALLRTVVKYSDQELADMIRAEADTMK